MINLLPEIKEILESVDGLKVADGVNIYLGTIPLNHPNTCINLELSGGSSDNYLENYHQQVEIKILSNKSETALNKLQLAFDKLHKLSNTQTTNAYIYFATAVMGATFVGKDANNNSVYRFSVEITYRKGN